MVLSSVLTRSSRALLKSNSSSSRSATVEALNFGRSSRTTSIIYGGRRSHHVLSSSSRASPTGTTVGCGSTEMVVLRVVYLQQRNFWSWKGGGAGQDSGNGGDAKASEEASSSAGGGRKGEGTVVEFLCDRKK